MRLQTIVSREVDPRDVAVVTVGSIHAGTEEQHHPGRGQARAQPALPRRRRHASACSPRSSASCAPRPGIRRRRGARDRVDHSLPPTINDVDATARLDAGVRPRLRRRHRRRPRHVHRQRGRLVVRPRVRRTARLLVLGRRRPADVRRRQAAGTVERDIPTNHSPFFAPVSTRRSSAAWTPWSSLPASSSRRADHERAAEPQENPGGLALDPRGTGVRKP